MASGYADANFHTKNIRAFIDDVEKSTDGKLKITLNSNDTLIKLDAIKRAVEAGQIPIGEMRLGVYGTGSTPGAECIVQQPAEHLGRQLEIRHFHGLHRIVATAVIADEQHRACDPLSREDGAVVTTAAADVHGRDGPLVQLLAQPRPKAQSAMRPCAKFSPSP